MFNPKYNTCLTQLFSRPALLELAESGTIDLAKFIIKRSDLNDYFATGTWSAFYSSAYAYLRKNYRNEYVFKNTITNKILLGRHSFNTASLQTELRAANCKADTVIFNGTSTAYEVKSDYDTYERLERQLAAYRKVFDRIFVVVSEKKAMRALESVPEDIGVIALTNRETLSTKRDSASHINELDPGLMFDSLRKDEYLPFVEVAIGEEITLPNTKVYSYCRELFGRLENQEAHRAFVEIMRERVPSRDACEAIKGAPQELKAALVSSNLGKYKTFLLEQALPQLIF